MTKRSSGRRLGFKEFLLSLFIMIIVWAAGDLLGIGSPAPPAPEPDPTGAVQVFFTAPDTQTEGLDVKLIDLIDAAEATVDVAAFDFELEEVAAALVRAADRGVRVRLVTDSDYAAEPGTVALQNGGIPVVFDEREAFMHNKFVVLDGARVWTGSMNLTWAGVNRHNNNVVLVTSSRLAENYTAEFEEMFTDRAFGPTSPDTVPYPNLDLNGVQVETYFESEGAAEDRIVDLINGAEERVRVMAFVLTDDAIARALITQHRAGRDVAGVLESRNTDALGADYDALRQAGVDVRADGNPYLLHHKVILIDDAIVITGSYNFSASAAGDNDENLIVLHSEEIGAAYAAEFEAVWAVAEEE